MDASDKAARDADFSAFVASETPRLVRVAIGLTGNPDAARELVQLSLVKTYGAWPRIRRDEAYAYTRRVLANARVDAWRATRREVVTETPPEPPVAVTTRTEDRDHLVHLLAALPRRQRAVIVLRYYEDLSEADVAHTLGISVGAVKSAAARGLAALRGHAARLDATEAGHR